MESKSDPALPVSQGRADVYSGIPGHMQTGGLGAGALVLGSALLSGVHTTLLPGTEPKAT